INPWFVVSYLGPVVFSGLAALLHLSAEHRAVLPWATAAFVLYAALMIITARVHLPLNAQLKNAGDPHHIANPAEIRQRYGRRWVPGIHVRTVLAVATFACLALSLVVRSHG